MAIDTHIHLFTRALPRARNVRHDPGYDATLDKLTARAAGTSVDRFVIVQPSFLGTDNTFLLEEMRAHPELIAGVAVLDPATPDDDIEHLTQAGIRGIRLNLLGRDFTRALDAPTLRLVSRCAEHGLHIEVHDDGSRLPRVLEKLGPLAPTLIIDHFGRPNARHGGLDSEEFRALLQLGSGKDWYVKISAPYRCPDINVQLAWQQFHQQWGPERLLWGSDWPWTQHESLMDYASWCHPFDQKEDLPTLLEANALRVYAAGQSESLSA